MLANCFLRNFIERASISDIDQYETCQSHQVESEVDVLKLFSDYIIQDTNQNPDDLF